jgi:polyisoprenoid-binding protein YceI
MSTTTWKIDPAHSGVEFTVRHLVVAKVRGCFRRYSAKLVIDDADLVRSSVEVSIEAASVDTGEAQRDGHLRSPGFLDVENFPALTFKSRQVERVAEDAYRLIGDLTIRGVTKEIATAVRLGGFVTDPWGSRRVGFTAEAAIQRSDFGMVWNQVLEAGGLALSDRVDIGIEIEAIAEAPQQAVA